MTAWRGLVLLLCVGIAACGASATPFSRALARADSIHGSGRYHEAALRYIDASRLADRRRDRDEALYRAAGSYRQSGDTHQARAVLDELVRTSPSGERLPRARYDLAVLTLESGDVTGGHAQLDAVIRSHPESGIAAGALLRRLGTLDGSEAQRAYLDTLIPTLEKTTLGAHLHYSYARSLEHDGKLREARDRFVEVARRYPFPAGSLWDDALFRAAELDVRLGDARGAILRLESILAERDRAYLVGSYERSRYPEAQQRIGELYRDALHDRVRARAAFEKLWSDFPTSRLRDDGAWEAARLGLEAGDAPHACRLLDSLARTLPESRYVGCIPRLCPEFRPVEGAICREYLLRK